jgi:hypothetical protein
MKVITFFTGLVLLFHQFHIEFSNSQITRRVKYIDRSLLEWVKRQNALLTWPREYYKFLNSVRGVINPSGEAGKVVYYPGIGPHGLFLDLVTPLLATDCDTIVSVDLGSGADTGINLEGFKMWIKCSLSPLIEQNLILEEDIKIEYIEEERKFICTFPFRGRERRLIVYYGKSAGEFFPSELENGFDVLITRWVPHGMEIGEKMSKTWLQKMRAPGYIITSGIKSYKEGERDLKVPPSFWEGFELKNTDYLGPAPRIMFFLKGK